MDLIKATKVNAVEFATSLSKVESLSERKECEFPALEEWELAMAGGGEAIVCW
jgi:hypothetical protein